MAPLPYLPGLPLGGCVEQLDCAITPSFQGAALELISAVTGRMREDWSSRFLAVGFVPGQILSCLQWKMHCAYLVSLVLEQFMAAIALY